MTRTTESASPASPASPASSSDCATEPIQIPGSIQPHGILIALRASDFTILQMSKNVFELLGVEATELLHQPLSRLMEIDPVRNAVKRLGERVPRLLNPIPLEISVNGRRKTFDGILHRSGRVINLELEPHVAGPEGRGFGGFYETIRDVASRLFQTDDVQDLCDVACEEVRKITGFDRVMLYRFDEDWNGTVVAEAKAERVSSFLNHHFPATDIPKQARDLYTINWLRLIPDVNYVPSPLVPTINPLTDRSLDLSNSVLRSVSPVHIEYLKNMKLGASMSVSILKNKQLYGLISCHHMTSHFLPYDIRVSCEFIGQMLSSQIEMREQSADYDHKLQLKTIYTHLLAEGGAHEDLTLALEKNASSLLALTDSQGAALCLGGQRVLIGKTPNLEQMSALIAWLKERNEPMTATDSLRSMHPPAKDFAGVASGLLAISIPKQDDDFIIWFRPEQKTELVWGGNPAESKIWSSTDSRYHPRASFEAWYQNVEGHSKKWRPAEIDVAQELRAAAIGLSSRATTKSPAAVDRREVAPPASIQTAVEKIARPAAEKVSSNLFSAGNLELIDGFLNIALALLDSSGVIRSWSSGASRMMGFSAREVIGKPFSFLLPETEALINKGALLTRSADQSGYVTEELWVYRKDGSSFWAKLGLHKTNEGAVTEASYSLIIEDITKEKAAEEELKATKVAAEAANRTKSAFLANISHEIRTPLGAVLGFAELMSAPDQTDQERAELYERVKRNGQQLTALINDLLDMSKAEAGRLEVELIDFDLLALLNDIEQTFLPSALEKKIRLRLTIDDNVPAAIRSDPTRIRQILSNLLSNALKFTVSGFVHVHVAVERNQNEKHLCMRVADSGRGMTIEEQERLFQPFAQADVSMTRKFGGTGLGLFISRRLARALGGDMRIEHSELGKGTTFLASVDVSQDAVLQLRSPSRNGRDAQTKTALKGMSVLLVDDSPDNRELISIFLRGAGATVTTAENGRKGVDLARKENFDVVLMDIQMPIMDGQQAMRELKQSDYPRPVIALTAHAMKEEREQSLALGFSAYLTKPVNRAELTATVGLFRP